MRQSYHGTSFPASSLGEGGQEALGKLGRSCRCPLWRCTQQARPLLRSATLAASLSSAPSSSNLTLCFLHSLHEHGHPHCRRPHRKWPFSSALGWGGTGGEPSRSHPLAQGSPKLCPGVRVSVDGPLPTPHRQGLSRVPGIRDITLRNETCFQK